jgi:plasmid stabilization system protein ParE
MAVQVLVRPEFVRTVVARVGWLVVNREPSQIDRFLDGLEIVRQRIALSPEAGAALRESGGYVLRQRLFPRPLPYIAYYAHRTRRPITEVYLVRLYAFGQARDELDMSEWPW